MLLFVEFDVSADIIDVPETVVNNKDQLRSDFLKWLYDRNHHHKYWTKIGGQWCVCYRSDAFVEWLNAVVLDKSEEKAAIVQQYVSIKNEKKLPSVFF